MKKKKREQKKSQKKGAIGVNPSRDKNKKKIAKKPSDHNSPSSHSSQTKKEVQLTQKIRLDSSSASYRNFFHSQYSKRFKRTKKFLSILFRIFAYSLVVIFMFLLGLFVVFGRDLPDVSKLKDMEFLETTNIYDREGNVLYSIYGQENRKYVPLHYIAPSVVNATIATEDKNFYHHLGFDPVGIIRAQLKNIEEDQIKQGASTITQQLAKKIFLSPERTYDRKIKELLLSLQIEWMFSKDEILEMYFNEISYGWNAYGIEAAAKTFFGKSSHDLSLVESAVLASLPKAPSSYSPYGENRKALMGYCKDETQPDVPHIPEVSTELDSQEVVVEDSDTVMEESTEVVEPDDILPDYEATGDADENPVNGEEDETETEGVVVCTSPYDPKYVWGRKDYVLERMVEDGYITQDEMNAAWKDGLDLTFADPIHKIEAPHFVFYVKELLEQKYGKELVENGGLEVKTTLDPRMQSIAEEGVMGHAEDNLQHYNANNAGLVALDVKTGEVLAMVGSVDYWNNDIDGQVNVTTSFRQPGSSFKPLVYAAAMQSTGMGSGTILGDYKTVFNKKDVPRNADNMYKGRMTIHTALALSRNIPAIKAYYLAGEEEVLLNFFDKIGLQSLRQFKEDFNKDAETRGWTFNYGWPLSLGSGEVRLLDLVNAYGIFPNQGKYIAANPIVEVRDRNGNILEKNDSPSGEQVIDPQVAFTINYILSDVNARPGGTWRANMTIPEHTVAAKTGTSNKKLGRSIYPNNNLIIGYTPNIVVGVWVGNTDGSHMKGNAWGFSDAAPIWKHFLTEILKDKPDEKFVEPPGMKWVGKEVYPSFAQLKMNFDKRFRKIAKPKPPENGDTLSAGSSGGDTLSAGSPPSGGLEPAPRPSLFNNVNQGF